MNAERLSALHTTLSKNSQLDAILGGGPAGAALESYLPTPDTGCASTREAGLGKACGGGVTNKALAEFPFLAEAVVERNWIKTCESSARPADGFPSS